MSLRTHPAERDGARDTDRRRCREGGDGHRYSTQKQTEGARERDAGVGIRPTWDGSHKGLIVDESV